MSYYSRTTLDVCNFIKFCNGLLANPTFSQTQKKIICEGFEETLKSNITDSPLFNTIYWIEHGRRLWIDDGCPIVSKLIGYPVSEVKINIPNTYIVKYVDLQYVGYERYSRRYYSNYTEI